MNRETILKKYLLNETVVDIGIRPSHYSDEYYNINMYYKVAKSEGIFSQLNNSLIYEIFIHTDEYVNFDGCSTDLKYDDNGHYFEYADPTHSGEIFCSGKVVSKKSNEE